MAGKQIDLNELSAAVDTFCKIFDNCTYVKPGSEMFEITTGDDEKILVSLVDGKIDCPRKPEMKEKLIGIIMDQRGSEAPKEAIIPPVRTNLPVKARNGNGGALVKSGAAVRDIQVQDLTFEDIKTYICEDATDQEAMIFLKLCQARNLNPFLRDAYLIKYDKTKPAQMVVGKDAFTKKAEDHPKFNGYKAGIIVRNPESVNGLDYREGTFLVKGEELLGGWAEVYRSDRVATPYKMSIPMNEYSTGKSNWITKPATMIRKVALVQALREAFPSEFSGMYDQAELGINPEKEVAEAA